MSAGTLPEGFRHCSIRFQNRFKNRFYGAVAPDPRVLPEFSASDSGEERKEKLGKYERHFHKLGARTRRNTALTGKAGRPPEPETLVLYQKHYVERKSWDQSFDELWSEDGRKPPVPGERARVRRHLTARTRAYAKAHPVADAAPGK